MRVAGWSNESASVPHAEFCRGAREPAGRGLFPSRGVRNPATWSMSQQREGPGKQWEKVHTGAALRSAENPAWRRAAGGRGGVARPPVSLSQPLPNDPQPPVVRGRGRLLRLIPVHCRIQLC